jgi:malonate decarboxylase gamma subunit
MTLDEVLKSLFPLGHKVSVSDDGCITGSGQLSHGVPISVIGIANGVALGTAQALPLAKQVLQVIEAGAGAKAGAAAEAGAGAAAKTAILVLVDTQGQLMARRDEMRGLNEYLSHLAKTLLLASELGHRTIGLQYGKAAAGAFLATALATDYLAGLPGAAPSVMDLPSVARVTKLPESTLREMAKTTPVFAPGLDHMVQMGAFAAVWDPDKPLSTQLEAALSSASPKDVRDTLGEARNGRTMAAAVAKRVNDEATRDPSAALPTHPSARVSTHASA